MAGVSIFIDYENLTFILQRQEYCKIHHGNLGEGLMNYAKQFGDIHQAVMWAKWDRFQGGKRSEENPQALFSGLGFDCLYLLNPSDRNYIEESIAKKLSQGGGDLDRILLVSGDYTFPNLVSHLKTQTDVFLAVGDHFFEQDLIEAKPLFDVLPQEEVVSSLDTPRGMEPSAFYIWMQRALQEELRRRSWQGMSFHMLARLLVERNLCEEDVEAQFHINQAVREGFLERKETELPTGRRVLLTPTVIERVSDPMWTFDDEFRWAQLIWALEMILKRNPWWEYVTFSRLREELEKWSLISGADDLQQVIEQAVEKGIYLLEIEEGGAPLFRKKYKYTLGEVDQDFSKVQDIPVWVHKTMRHLLEENVHWHGVSFSKLLDELMELPEIAKGDAWIDRQRLKDWCNFLVAIGFLHAFRGRPRVIEGELRDPPTLLRLVPEHNWVQHIQKLNSVEKIDEVGSDKNEKAFEEGNQLVLRDLEYFRLIVVIEHYLHISSNDAVIAGWMPMSTLFHVMGRGLDRAFCNAIVRSGREKGILEIRTHDPRPGQHPARGAHLNLEHELVVDARKRVLRLLDVIQSIQERSSAVELTALEARLCEDPFFGESHEERIGWIELMREENLILVRPFSESDNEDGSSRFQCSLNFRDRYILALLEILYPSSTAPETFIHENRILSARDKFEN